MDTGAGTLRGARAAERIFIWGGGGGDGGKDKKGHYNVKKGTNDAHHLQIMKHPCRHKVSFYMLSVVFFFLLGELNKLHLPPPPPLTR